MDVPQKVRAAERALQAAGVSVRQFCFRAELFPETWRIWREGRGLPQMAKWQKAMATLEQIKRERRKELARKRAARKAQAERLMKPQL